MDAPRHLPQFGLYVHWPYCSRICPYCDFNVYRQRDNDPAPLLAALTKDIAAGAASVALPLDTIFLGGGTPSLLSGRDIETLLGAARDAFGFAADCEITIECNPEDAPHFADFASAGINRFSIGVQALNDADLKALGRWHSARDAMLAVEVAAKTGARVSMDLIYARSAQTLMAWETELRSALSMSVEHVSLYQLTIEANTAFERAVKRGRLAMPDNDSAADFYGLTQSICDAAGMPAYEVSNHARSVDAWSRHNLLYWTHAQWLGIGPGAHGRFQRGGARIATRAAMTVNDYIARMERGADAWDENIALTDREEGEEMLLAGMRTVLGADVAQVEAKFGAPLAWDAVSPSLIRRRDSRVFATAEGRLVLNYVTARLLGA
jgi:oxygen-independent coproporphyrinogen-3 oxidase